MHDLQPQQQQPFTNAAAIASAFRNQGVARLNRQHSSSLLGYGSRSFWETVAPLEWVRLSLVLLWLDREKQVMVQIVDTLSRGKGVLRKAQALSQTDVCSLEARAEMLLDALFESDAEQSTEARAEMLLQMYTERGPPKPRSPESGFELHSVARRSSGLLKVDPSTLRSIHPDVAFDPEEPFTGRCGQGIEQPFFHPMPALSLPARDCNSDLALHTSDDTDGADHVLQTSPTVLTRSHLQNPRHLASKGLWSKSASAQYSKSLSVQRGQLHVGKGLCRISSPEKDGLDDLFINTSSSSWQLQPNISHWHSLREGMVTEAQIVQHMQMQFEDHKPDHMPVMVDSHSRLERECYTSCGVRAPDWAKKIEDDMCGEEGVRKNLAGSSEMRPSIRR